MADYKVSLRYAISLLETAKEKKNVDTVSTDMELVVSVIDSNRHLKLMLDSPVVKPKVKKSILSDIFRGKIDEDSLKFIVFVVEKNREEFLLSILRKYLELKDEHLGIVNVKIKAAQEFSDEQSKQLKGRFESLLNKQVRFKFEIDKSIIGGFIARIGDTVYDASIKHQLNILKKQFIEGSI
ncbi:MAG: ATP synthase F1 subunit delta [Ignavibacteriaceae bacterium]